MKKIKLFSLELQRFARSKNALRGHFIQAFTPGTPTAPKAADATWLELAKWIATVDDDTDEETDDTGFYDGDGTPEKTVVSVSKGYSFEGFYDPEDKAQALVSDMQLKIGDGRKVWHKVVSADGTKTWIGLATVTDIVTGSGDATEFEAFECTITFNQIPEETKGAAKAAGK